MTDGTGTGHRDLGERAAALRHAMVEALVCGGELTDSSWRDAFTAVPRHVLVPRFFAQPGYRLVDGSNPEDQDEWLHAVYSDTTLITKVTPTSVTSSGTMPSLIAAMLQYLDVHDGHTVLQVGTGTGYTAALLAARLGDEPVTSIDIDPKLTRAAQQRLAVAGYRPKLVTGDGADGHPPAAPYARVLATCGLPHIPQSWLAQTKPGGKILAPVAAGLALLNVAENTTATGRFLSPAYFMPLRSAPTIDPAPRPATEPEGPSREAVVPSMAVYDNLFRFHLSIALPGLVYGNGGSDLADLYLSHPDGSTAHITPAGRVTQAGPRHLWDQVEAAHANWDTLGRPAHDAYRLSLGPDHQTVQLDDNHSWQLPDQQPGWPTTRRPS